MNTPPSTPLKKRVRDVTNLPVHASPTKRLRPTDLNSLASPVSLPHKPTASPISVLQKPSASATLAPLRALFQRGSSAIGSLNGALCGRSTEAQFIEEFIINGLSSPENPASLYVSGPPGTGKTAQVNTTIDHLAMTNPTNNDITTIGGVTCIFIRINCMTLEHPHHIFQQIARKARCATDKLDLENIGHCDALVVVLDEMDALVNRDQQILVDLFRMTKHNTGCRLVVLGIANALDLTDKFLPRLMQHKITPLHLVFCPYTLMQLLQVIRARAASLESHHPASPAIHPVALDMCTRKVAASTGDIRKAFDLMYLSVEMAIASGATQVHISHVAKASLSIQGQGRPSQVLSRLNLMQKAVLCSVFSYMAHHETSARPTVNALHHHYAHHVQPESGHLLGTLRQGEFLDILSALESHGSISLGVGKRRSCLSSDGGLSTVSPNIAKHDLVTSIGEIGVLHAMIGA